jgi:hypothetical protein
MKNFLILFALTTLFFSCAKDDEVPPSIIGKWEFVSQINYDAAGTPGAENNYSINRPNCSKCYLINKENNMSVYGDFNSTCEVTERSYSNEFDGKKFKFPIPASYFVGTIVKLTETELIFDCYGFSENKTYTFKLKRVQ